MGQEWTTSSSFLLTLLIALLLIIAYNISLNKPFMRFDPIPIDKTSQTPRDTTRGLYGTEKQDSVDDLRSVNVSLMMTGDGGSLGKRKESIPRILNEINKYYPTLIRRFKGQRFLPDYKSPCIREKTGVKCFPYFYLAGVSKSGTTDLWMNILRHPQVVNRVKEGSWWAEGKKNDIGILNYLKVQSRVVLKAGKSTRLKNSLIIGDGSANTLWCNKQIMSVTMTTAQRGELPFVWADVMHAVQPDAKIIAILRQPTERTISAYFAFHRGRPKSPQDFHNRVKKGIETFRHCLKKRSLRTCANLDYYPRIQVSVYVAHVQEWLRVYPRKQLLFIRTEDWHNHANLNLLPSVFKFLEIEPKTEKQLRPLKKAEELGHITNKQVTSTGERKYGTILAATRRLLDEFYRPYNEQLANLLADNRFLWNDKPS